MYKKVLVTGGCGFIGSHICDTLLENKFEVVVIDNLSKGSIKNLPKKCKLYKIDLNSKELIERVIKKEKPFAISHHASGLVSVPESMSNPHNSFEDLLTTVNLIQVAVENHVEKIIFASSANVYQNTKLKINEKSYLKPGSPYGITKLAIENYLSLVEKTEKVKVIIFRYFNVYGPRQKIGKNTGIVPMIIDSFKTNEQMIIFGDGNQTRDFVFVKDVALANVLAIKKNVSGIYNVGTGRDLSLINLISVFEKIYGKKLNKRIIKNKINANKSQANIFKIRKELGWKPKYSIEDGLRITKEYYG